MSDSGGARSRGRYPVVLRIVLGIGFLIALAATGLVVFADDVRMLRLAAVLALWAALIAAFAATRSRRDARAAAMRESEAQLAYQLELHREVAARREYEADLTRQVASAQSDQLAELRGQLDRLTSVLSSLVDGELTVSRLTLSAESARFRSLSTPDRAAVGGSRYEAVTMDAGLAGLPEAEPLAGRALPAQDGSDGTTETSARAESAGGVETGAIVESAEPADVESAEPADVESAEPAPPIPAESTERPRPDAPAASWARRHRAGAEPAGPRSPVTDIGDAGTPVTPAADAGRAVTEAPGAAEAVGADAGVPDLVDLDDVDVHVGGHESGVPLAELLAAYGLSGRSRRRRQE